MCDKQKHGGPDDEGFYSNESNSLVLGHRRLALIDLSPGGHQPMPYDGERYWITYNGELYNYPELKEELLKAGFSFKSASDTEVILAAFAAWGTHAFKRFNGMFAFALWDSVTQKIYLVRDASGIKPLYFAVSNQGLVFASEVRAFKNINWLNEENKDWPVYLLAYGHLPEPITTLQQVRPLKKGCFICYHVPAMEWETESFTFFNYNEQINKKEDAIEKIQELLDQAVKRHLISDAPLGVFLSGGIDSSIMTILASKYHKDALKTLSIVFEEKYFSEKKYQDILIDKLKSPNSQKLLTEKEFQLHFHSFLNAMDLPGCDGINTWFISKHAKENGLKAVISGLGGDELFGGYPSFGRMPQVNLLEKLPDFLLNTGRHFGSKKIRRLANLTLGSTKGSYLLLRGLFIPAAIARQLDANESEIWKILEAKPVYNTINMLSPGNQASWLEMHMYMQNQLLRDSDVMSMAHGVEIRLPFLDKEFVQLILQIESGIKYTGTTTKPLLVESFRHLLPEAIWNRPKMGFTLPFTEWMGKNGLVKDSILDSGKTGRDNFEKFKQGKLHWSQLMSLLLVQQHTHAA